MRFVFRGVSCAAVAMVVLSAWASAAHAASLKCYWTTDELDIDQKPPGNSWALVDETTRELGTTVGQDDAIWIACLNTTDADRNKYFGMRLRWGAGDLQVQPEDIAAFTSDDDEDVAAKTQLELEHVFDDDDADAVGADLKMKWTPQPKWERVKLISFANPAKAVTVSVKAWSKCSNVEKDFEFPEKLFVSNATFGASGAVIGAPRITEVWIFPETAATDTLSSPVLTAPPATGTWTPAFVANTPDGEPRPQGGVRFVTDGAGLSESDVFVLELAMLGEADERYELFALETEFEEYFELGLAVDAGVPVPLLSPASGVLLGALLAALGAGRRLARSRRRGVGERASPEG